AAIPLSSASDTGRLDDAAVGPAGVRTTPPTLRFWLRGAVAAGAVLVVLAVGASLAFRPRGGGRVPPDRPVAAPVAAAAGVEAARPAGEPAPVPALAPPARHDFRVQVEMLGSRPGPDGVLRLVAGQEVRFRVTVE